MIDRIPIHLGLLAVDQTLFQEVQEQVLLALIVFDVAGGEFAGPVQRQAHRFQLAAHRRDVFVGPALGVDLVLHGGVFGRHAEGVPAHRMQHVVAARALVAGNHIAHGVIAHMAHMDAARGIGEHLEDVVLLARVVVVGQEDVFIVPFCLPAGFGIARVVTFGGHVFDVPEVFWESWRAVRPCEYGVETFIMKPPKRQVFRACGAWQGVPFSLGPGSVCPCMPFPQICPLRLRGLPSPMESDHGTSGPSRRRAQPRA